MKFFKLEYTCINMANVTFLIFGFIDLLAGLVLALSSGLILGDIGKYLGVILIGKGLWTIATSFTA